MAHNTDIKTLDKEEQMKILDGFQKVWAREKKEQKINQTWVAEKMGMKQASFSQYLSGDTPISMRFLIRLCNVLKVPPEEIYAPITDLLPNRKHAVVKYKTSDAITEHELALTYNPQLNWVTMLVDKPIQWTLLSGKTCFAEIGTALSCLELHNKGQWYYGTKIKADNFVINKADSTEWSIVNRVTYENMMKLNLIKKSYILMAIGFI